MSCGREHHSIYNIRFYQISTITFDFPTQIWTLEIIKVNNGALRSKWKKNAVQEYTTKLEGFLDLLLLLVHICSGQPARGTETPGLRYRNTATHRNVFLEHGLVSTVTVWHKGYTATGSTKIIHRYLPREVGELLIYYLLLIRPFPEAIEL